MNRTLYYIIGVPVVLVTLLYTSLVRRFIYMLPTFFGKLIFTITPPADERNSIVIRILLCCAGMALVLNNHFFYTVWDVYSLYANYAADLWSDGADSISSLSGAIGGDLSFGGVRVVTVLRLPEFFVWVAGFILALSVGITLMIDAKLKE